MEVPQEGTFAKGWGTDEVVVTLPQAADIPAGDEKKEELAASPEGENKGEAIPQPEPAKEEVKVEKPVEEEKKEPPVEKEPYKKAGSDDFEHKWKSVQGIVKHKDSRIKELEDELAKAKAKPPVEEEEEEIKAKAEPAKTENVLRDLRKQHHQAIMDGDEEIADKIAEQIEEAIINKALSTFEQRSSQKSEDDLLNELVNDSYKTYPFLDPESESINVHANRLVRATATDYIAQGKSRVESLSLAVAEVGPIFASGKMADSAKEEKSLENEEKLREMGVVKTKAAPINPSKGKGEKSFASGWELAA